ncbi:IS66 family insertion sequence element accessory protein TnpA [Pontibacter mangrovi]|uniref:IS66 family insertion sequence element accessory protein TnpB n=1 Tax=Pontibacter mangrovi TaxID=2589816 RepID=A0A501W7X2_9BACT|nr:IS66 family insertion sequence element accessory protein TnpB [Pontibacter mangrovi]TPE43341.1 IS66 family insertion sequence element accessory protein TnpB [Pontibacter mangrovi]
MTHQEKMLQLVELYEESGLSQRAFCQEQGLKLSQFTYWIHKVRKEKQATSGFVQLSPPEPAAQLEVIYPNGVKVRLPARDLQLVSRLLHLY